MTTPDPAAPVAAAVRELHRGKSLGELVRAARWRRKPRAEKPAAEQVEESLGELEKHGRKTIMTIESPRTRKEIVADLREHLSDGGGTMNDSTTDELYREWHNITDGRDTDLESVERWVVSVA